MCAVNCCFLCFQLQTVLLVVSLIFEHTESACVSAVETFPGSQQDTQIDNARVHTHYTHTRTHTQIHTHVQRTHAHTHAHSSAHTRTHTHSLSLSLSLSLSHTHTHTQAPTHIHLHVHFTHRCLVEWGVVSRKSVPARLDVALFAAGCAAITHCYRFVRMCACVHMCVCVCMYVNAHVCVLWLYIWIEKYALSAHPQS
jgi:hypothetical protein